MMETEQPAGSCPAPSQTAIKTWLPSSTRGATIAPSYITSRFHGDGVCYKAKLIGMDTVPDVQGEKMCWDSMMKLKGLEEAARKQRKHKQKVWLKVSYSGLKIVDEKTGDVVYDHEKSKINYLTKDESDPRALAYIYQYKDTCMLFYIKMANLAAPVLIDILEVCQSTDQETPQEPVETPKQNIPLLVINEGSAALAEELNPESVFSPRPETPPEHSNQTSSSNELMEVFAPPMKDPMAPIHILEPPTSTQASQTIEPESPQPMLSTTQILSMFHTQPVGGSPYASPQYSPTTMPWAQQGPLGKQWAQPYPGNMSAWAPPSVAAPPAGSQAQTHSVVSPQPGTMMGGNTAGCPTAPSPLHGHPVPVNSLYTSAGTTGAPQAVSPTSTKPSDGGFFDWDVLNMDEESIDVKALRARFNSKTSTSDTNSSRDSGSPKSPRPGFGRVMPLGFEKELGQRVSPTVPPLLASPGVTRPPRAEPLAAPIPSRPASFPRPPPSSVVRPPIQPVDASKVKQRGEMLQNMMMRHQRPLANQPPALGSAPAQSPAPASASTPLPLRQPPRQKSMGDVTPLRRPLPPEGPLPLKPKRPPSVNLEPYLRSRRGPALPAQRKSNDSPISSNRRPSLPARIIPPNPPQRSNKPHGLPHQIASMDIEDEQDPYDDIASFDKNDSNSDKDSQGLDEDGDDVYEFIDEDQVELNKATPEKLNKKDAKKQLEQEKKEQMERQKKQNELRKNFKLEGEVEVLHTARVRHDWRGGGKLDLSVRQGDSVEIIRVKNNPGGKWLARSLNGNYGYISNTCVDVDYEAVKRKVLQSRKTDMSALPPPPPDPPLMLNVEPNNRDSMLEDDDDYDDVEPISEDFPPPPPEISIDPKVEKELKKKFKYEGPLKVLHTVMVDPNSVIKKPGAKDLHVVHGEVLDVIQLTNNKKVLCRNQYGKYGYVFRSLLLPMEGDIYDDVDYAGDVYDNDSPRTDY